MAAVIKENILSPVNKNTLSAGWLHECRETRNNRGAGVLNIDANWINFKISQRDNQTHGTVSQIDSVAILRKSD